MLGDGFPIHALMANWLQMAENPCHGCVSRGASFRAQTSTAETGTMPGVVVVCQARAAGTLRTPSSRRGPSTFALLHLAGTREPTGGWQKIIPTALARSSFLTIMAKLAVSSVRGSPPLVPCRGMAMHLSTVDYAILIVYTLFVLGIGFALKRFMKSSTDFFLSGRAIPAWITGLAFISANLGAQELVGMGASGAKYGMLTCHFYWIGASRP